MRLVVVYSVYISSPFLFNFFGCMWDICVLLLMLAYFMWSWSVIFVPIFLCAAFRYNYLNRKLKTMVKAYCHRFKIIEGPACTSEGGSQTAHHLLYNCKLYKERVQLKNIITKNADRWLINKNQLVTKYSNKFTKFISSIHFKKAINHCHKCNLLLVMMVKFINAYI